MKIVQILRHAESFLIDLKNDVTLTEYSNQIDDHLKVISSIEYASATSIISKSNDRLRKFAFTSSALRDIIFRIDENNIIFERMKRSRQLRREVYVVTLSEIDTQNAYHSTFNTHIASSDYYMHAESMKNQNFVIRKISLSIKLHKNTLLAKSRFYHQLKSHSHRNDSIQVMRIEIQNSSIAD
jgi:hypothetical protein